MIFKEQFYKAIVPINCGSRKGTAFFVEPGRLLTARHVVIGALFNNIPVEVICQGISRVCSKVELLKDSELCDVAILTLPAYEHEFVFPLLSHPANVEKRLFDERVEHDCRNAAEQCVEDIFEQEDAGGPC